MAIIYYHADGTQTFINAKRLTNTSALAIIRAAFDQSMEHHVDAHEWYYGSRDHKCSIIDGVLYVNVHLIGLPYNDLTETAVCFSFAGNIYTWEGAGYDRRIVFPNSSIRNRRSLIAACCVMSSEGRCISTHPFCPHQPNSGVRLKRKPAPESIIKSVEVLTKQGF